MADITYPVVLQVRIETVEDRKRFYEDVYMVPTESRGIRRFIERNSDGHLFEIGGNENYTWNYHMIKSGTVSIRFLNHEELTGLMKRTGISF